MSAEQASKIEFEKDSGAPVNKDGSPIQRLIKNLEIRDAEDRSSQPQSNGAEKPAGPDYSIRKTGFVAVREDLERTSREAAAMVELLERNSQHLASAEMQREASYQALNELVPVVEATARELKAAMEASKEGKTADNLDVLFDKNGKALDDLEAAATALKAQFVWCRAAWRQYQDSVDRAKQLRAAGYGTK